MEEAGEEKIAGESGGVADGQKRVEQAGEERVEEMLRGRREWRKCGVVRMEGAVRVREKGGAGRGGGRPHR